LKLFKKIKLRSIKNIPDNITKSQGWFLLKYDKLKL